MAIMSTEREIALRTARGYFDAGVRAVKPDQWHDPTPCSGWDVRALVNHVVGEQLWVPPLLAGQTIADVGTRFDGDQLGDDPAAVWRSGSEDAAAAWSAPGAWDRSVALSFGVVPATVYASQLTADMLIHGWDLAKAVGAAEPDEADLVRLVLADVEPDIENWRAAGAFGPAPETAPDADDLTRLLALAGRRRDWTPPTA